MTKVSNSRREWLEKKNRSWFKLSISVVMIPEFTTSIKYLEKYIFDTMGKPPYRRTDHLLYHDFFIIWVIWLQLSGVGCWCESHNKYE